MKFSQNALLRGSPKEAAEILFVAGQTLTGKPLRRSSWQEIAQITLNQERLSRVLLMRLRVAQNREDALRVLRMARKRAARQQSNTSRKGKPTRRTGQTLLRQHQQQVLEYDYFDDPDWAELMWHPGMGDGNDFLEWQAAQTGKLATVLPYQPLSILQEIALQVAWQRRQQPDDHSIRAAIGEDTYRRLLEMSGAREIILSQEEETFFAVHNLHHLLERSTAHPVVDGFGLAGLDILAHYGVQPDGYTVAWMAVAHWFGQRFQQEPDETYRWLVAGLHFFVAHSPAHAAQELLRRFCLDPKVHRAWLPLLPYFLPRLSTLIPGLHLGHLAMELPSNWEQSLVETIGSLLPLVQMRNNLADLLTGAARVQERHELILHPLLITGGGTLASQAYPTFSLTARPALSLVTPQTLAAMQKFTQSLYQGSWGLRYQPTKAVGELLRLALDPAGAPGLEWMEVWSALVEHAIGYVMLVEEVYPGAAFRIRRKHVRRFWEQQSNGGLNVGVVPNTLETVVNRYGVERLIEGWVHALLSLFNERWPTREGQEISLKEAFILTLRTLALHYRSGLTEQHAPHIDPYNPAPELVRSMADLLVRQSQHAPLELAQALGIGHEQGLPLLAGGRMTEWEHRVRHLLKEAAGGVIHRDESQPPRIFTCHPLAKTAALERGDLGGDCSSDAVPLRATSPHHIYYGVWDNGVQQRGYMTVFECWAENEEGVRLPALCLETINVPIPIFDAVQEDLLLIFDAIARSRGLHSPIALTTGYGTWNYQNGAVLRHSRRFRQGEAVTLSPADPVHWQLYSRVSREGSYYSSFNGHRGSGLIRILAAFDPERDLVQPENLAEAERLTTLPTHRLISTLRVEGQMVGFISSWPAPLSMEGGLP